MMYASGGGPGSAGPAVKAPMTSSGATSCRCSSPDAICSAKWQATRWLAVAPGTSTTRSCGRSVSQQRLLLPRAARVEPAARRRVRGRREVAAEQDLLARVLDLRVGHRHGGHERAGVGVERYVVEARPRPPPRPAPPRYITADPVADVPYDGEVVGDHQIRQPQLVLEVLQQVDHLCLNGHVEGATPARPRRSGPG